jgi:hypothetical protein
MLPPRLPPVDFSPRINWQSLSQFAPDAATAPIARPSAFTGAAMPGSATEFQDLAAEAAGLGNIGQLAAAHPMARGANAVGKLGMEAVRRAPGLSAALLAAAGITAAPGEAEPPSPLSETRDLIGRLRARQTGLANDLAGIDADEKGFKARFGKISSSSPKPDIQAVQDFLASPAGGGLYGGRDPHGRAIVPDGRWGDGTRSAIDAYLKGLESRRATIRTTLDKLGADLGTQTTRLTGLEGGERLREAEENVGPVRGFVRDWGPWAAMGAGGLLGHWTRSRAAHRVADETAGRARLLDAMITPRARQAQARAANVNEFWRAGGAGENVPFRTVQTERGFARRPGTAEPSDLFPPGPVRYRGSDYGVAGVAGVEAGVSGTLAYQAHQELTEAQAAAQRDPSAVNIDRLQRARDVVALTESLARGGAGVALGRLGGAWTHPYRDARPNVPAAEREQALLNQLLARDAKKAKARRK